MVGGIKQFVGEVAAEMKKVSWPTREQLRESTAVVIVVSLVITSIVAIMDWGLTSVFDFIFGTL